MMKSQPDAADFPAHRLHSPRLGKKGVVLTGAIFALSLTILSIIGAYGPKVFNETSHSKVTWRYDLDKNHTADDAIWTHEFTLDGLRAEQQLIYLKAQLYRTVDTSNDQEAKFVTDVTVSGVDEDGTEHAMEDSDSIFQTVKWVSGESRSEEISVWATNTILYPTYHVKMSIKPNDNNNFYVITTEKELDILIRPDMVYVHSDFTQWSMGWKICFQIITLLAMFSPIPFWDGLFAGFFVQMRNVSWKYWSDMQVWIASLLVALFFFNDPLFPFQVFADSESTSVGLLAFNMVVLGGFTSMILCFFLCTSEDISSEGMSQYLEKKGAAYYIPKTILCGALWILLTCFYAVARLDNGGSPQFDKLSNDGTYFVFQVVLGIFLGIWAAWFIVHMIKSLGRICSASLPYAFLFVITAITAVLMLVGVLTGSLYPLPDSPFKFLFFYGTFNIYVYTLAFGYAPENPDDAGEVRELQDNGMYDQLNPGDDNRGMI